MTVSSVFFAQQFLPVPGIVNARDLGPMGLTDEDIQTLRARYLE